MTYNYLLKFVLVGDSSVGKSCALLRFENDTFYVDHEATVGIEYSSKIITTLEEPLKVQVWDTSGQQVFRSITRSYYRWCCAVALVYDVTNRESFQNASRWLDQIRTHCNQKVSIMLVGNKTDLVERRVVSKEQGEKLAAEKGLMFGECSAKSGQGIEEGLAQQVLRKINSKQISAVDGKFGVRMGLHDEQGNWNVVKKKRRWQCC